MNKRRVVSMLLSVILLLTSFASFATPDNNTYVIDNGHGEFKFVDNNISTNSNKLNANQSKVTKIDTYLYQILDKDILNENKEYDKLIQVNDSTLLRVKEVKIDLNNSRRIEEVIDEYQINPMMANDIRELSLKVQNGSNVADELTIYTPAFRTANNNEESDNSISTPGTSSIHRYYYKGYLGYDYMDEIWHAESTITYATVRTGHAVKRYLEDSFTNLIEMIISGFLNTVTGGSWSLVEIFAHSPVLSVESTSGDVHQAGLDESKWRRYTSIDMGDGYGYNVGAFSDRSSHRFKNRLAIGREEDVAYSPWVSKECDNYNNLDVMAYKYRDLPWGERITSYAFTRTLSFDSVIQ